MTSAECKDLASRPRAPWVRVLAGLVAMALLAAPGAGMCGVLLETFGASRAVYEIFYMWFWMTVLAVFLCSLAGAALWAAVRLGEIATGLAR